MSEFEKFEEYLEIDLADDGDPRAIAYREVLGKILDEIGNDAPKRTKGATVARYVQAAEKLSGVLWNAGGRKKTEAYYEFGRKLPVGKGDFDLTKSIHFLFMKLVGFEKKCLRVDQVLCKADGKETRAFFERHEWCPERNLSEDDLQAIADEKLSFQAGGDASRLVSTRVHSQTSTEFSKLNRQLGPLRTSMRRSDVGEQEGLQDLALAFPLPRNMTQTVAAPSGLGNVNLQVWPLDGNRSAIEIIRSRAQSISCILNTHVESGYETTYSKKETIAFIDLFSDVICHGGVVHDCFGGNPQSPSMKTHRKLFNAVSRVDEEKRYRAYVVDPVFPFLNFMLLQYRNANPVAKEVFFGWGGLQVFQNPSVFCSSDPSIVDLFDKLFAALKARCSDTWSYPLKDDVDE